MGSHRHARDESSCSGVDQTSNASNLATIVNKHLDIHLSVKLCGEIYCLGKSQKCHKQTLRNLGLGGMKQVQCIGYNRLLPSVVYCQTHICWYKFVTVFWVKHLVSITISLFEVWLEEKVRGASSQVNFYLLNSLPNLKSCHLLLCSPYFRKDYDYNRAGHKHNMQILVCHPKLNSYWNTKPFFIAFLLAQIKKLSQERCCSKLKKVKHT